MRDDFADPKNFINRELSWLEFNRRVLEEAQDATQPLMERVKFLAIFASNLDEFFEIRVAGIKQQIDSGTADIGPDGLTPAEVFDAIQKTTHQMVDEIYQLWNDDIIPALAENNIHILSIAKLEEKAAQWVRDYFRKEVFPTLTPLAVDASHPFPQVLNKSHNLIIRARKPGNEDPLYAVVQVPRVVPRYIALPREADGPWNYIYLADLVKVHISELFPGLELEDVRAFRVTRNSDLYIDEEEAENLLRTIEQSLRRSSRGNVVRIEVEADCPEDFQEWLLDRFNLKKADLYLENGPLTLTHLMPLTGNESFAKLKDRPFTPAYDPNLPPHGDVWQLLRREDVLLHHPYESFDSIVDLVEAASTDPQVLAMKMTLYRTSGDSPIVKALINAAQNGKQVVALVELKARFDEANNIHWARALEEAGAHVVYGLVGLKTHCKALLIVRRDEDGIRHYAHLGTGNYHPRTARIYTDLSLFTTEPGLTQEVATLFNTLTGLAAYPGFKKLMVAPFDLGRRVRELIERERDHAKAGRPGRIIVKINSLVDEMIIKALYEASSAGVKIDLIVRGICSLRPGIPGVSENIRVISIVGRFLEHSRIYYFANDDHPQVYLASADWMPRNFYRRVEIAFPIEKPELLSEIVDVILPTFLKDRVKARELLPDGTYMRLKPRPGEEHSQAQLFFRERARQFFANLAKASQGKIVPVELAPASEDNVRN
jgi:polyphosphate kinase